MNFHKTGFKTMSVTSTQLAPAQIIQLPNQPVPEERQSTHTVDQRSFMVVPQETLSDFRSAHPLRLVWWLRTEGWQQAGAIRVRQVRQAFIFLGRRKLAGEKY
ncbi:MAG TPA: hypothetical protein DIW81_17590 [Planctomycetaceae bacterium]|nr:hypothetical protein [Planctomycetaceae bacterium]